MPRRVLVVGVTGFIGAAVTCRLLAEGVDVIGVSRGTANQPMTRHHTLDVGRVDPAVWQGILSDVEAVVYCAGTLQASPGESPNGVHSRGPAALYEACQRAAVRRVVHLSAIGVDRFAATDFSRSKRAGDEALMRSGLDWVVLRPSVVIGRAAFGGAALIRGLAALPLVPVPADAGALQAVHLHDVLDTILFFLSPKAPSCLAVDLVGPRSWRFEELVAVFRRWLGKRPAATVPMPRSLQSLAFALGDGAACLGWRSALRSTAGAEIGRGAAGDPAAWTALTGIVPRDIERVLLAEPASMQERWFAPLYLLWPWIFGLIALFWIATGMVALGPGWSAGIGLMNEGGVSGGVASAVVIAGALCDIAVGGAIAWRRTARYGLVAAIAVTLVYGVVGTALVPQLWADPMGPMLKILPILALHLVALGIVDDR